MPVAARDFPVVPPNLRWAIVVLALIVMVAAGGLAWALHRGQLEARSLPFVLLALLPMPLLWVALRRRRVRLQGRSLEVQAGVNTTRVAVAELDLPKARVVDLAEHREFSPGVRVNGTALPGYQAGHFIRVDGQRSFALITDRRRVLVLPERRGRRLLLSLVQPQALLDALAQADATATDPRGAR